MRKNNLYLILAFVMMLSGLGCKKDPVVDPNENELITTVKVVLTERVSGTQSIFEFKDLDGEGGAAPSKFDEIILVKGKVYGCNLQFLNESKTPADEDRKSTRLNSSH